MSAKHEAIDAVWDGSTDQARAMLLAAVRQVAGQMEEFTADDVWAALPQGVWIRERRLLGAVMRRAVQAGWCVGTPVYRESVSDTCHNRPMRVWRGRLAGRQAPLPAPADVDVEHVRFHDERARAEWTAKARRLPWVERCTAEGHDLTLQESSPALAGEPGVVVFCSDCSRGEVVR